MAKGASSGSPEPNPQVAPALQETAPARPVPDPITPGRNKSGPGSGSEDLTTKMLGEFRILRRLGRGGMAEVYLAEQTTLKRNVAIKVLHQDRVSDGSYLKRFQTEAMAAGSLNHPNIIQVLLIGEQNGIQFI